MNPYTLKKDPYSSHSIITNLLKTKYSSGKFLDVGCGPGFIGKMLNKNYELHGIDKNIEIKRLISPIYKQVCFLNVENDDFTSGSKYDAIIFGDILEHLINPKTVLKRYSSKYLKKGGSIIISLPNVAHWSIRTSLLFGNFDYNDKGILDSTHLRFFTYKSMRSLLSDCDLKIEKICYTPVPLPLIIPLTDFGKPLFILQELNYFLTGLWKNIFAYQFVFLCSKK